MIVDRNTYFVKLQDIFNSNNVNSLIYEKLKILSSKGHCIIITTDKTEADYTEVLLSLYSNNIFFDRLVTDCKDGEIVLL